MKSRIGECILKKIGRNRKEAILNQVHHESICLAIQELLEDQECSLSELCRLAEIQRSAYYKWLHRKESHQEAVNRKLADRIRSIHKKIPELGYRRMRDVLKREDGIHVSDNHVLRIMRILGLQSTVKFQRKGCTRSASNPQQGRKHSEQGLSCR